MIIDAILKINPNAQASVNAEDINQITWLNGTAPISKSQIEAMIPVVEQEIANKKAQQLANKQSALTKLSALGLTEAEIKAILG